MAHSFELKIADFVLAINAVKHATPAKDIRYYLNGVRVEVDDVHATFIATDGHRLATVKTFLVSPVPVPEPFEFSIDVTGIPLMLNWIKMHDSKRVGATINLRYERKQGEHNGEPTAVALPGELVLSINEQHLAVAARPHDEKFPDWRRVMANPGAFKNPTNDGAFNGEYLVDVAKVAKLFNQKYGGIKIKLDTGLALFECQNAEGVEFRETLMGMRV